MRDRIKPFATIRNFRDFGAYQGAEGRMVRRDVLFRSAHFGEASDEDLAALKRLNITVQADLRRPDERERHGHRWPDQGVRVILSDKGRATEAPHVRFLEQVAVNPDDSREWMCEYYRAAPYKPQHVDHFTAWFEALINLPEGEAVVVNCAAGKDRTGILCALTHHVLGVDRDTIFEDYLLTNTAANVAQRLSEMAKAFNANIGKDHPEAVYHPFVGVSADFLENTYAAIAAQSGTVDAYLSEVLGVGAAEQAALRARLLTPA